MHNVRGRWTRYINDNRTGVIIYSQNLMLTLAMDLSAKTLKEIDLNLSEEEIMDRLNFENNKSYPRDYH